MDIKSLKLIIIFLIPLLISAENKINRIIDDSEIVNPEVVPRIINNVQSKDYSIESTKRQAPALAKEKALLFVTEDGVEFLNKKKKSLILSGINFSIEKIFGEVKPASGGEKCLVCHNGIEIISSNHDFKCTYCHKGNARSRDIFGAHENMVSNPSDLQREDMVCEECHKGHVQRVKGSLMATSAGEISITRYQWGAQDSLENIFGVVNSDHLLEVPEFSKSQNIVDDMLRKKCLRCHLNSISPARTGDYRSTGCAACHMIYSNDGISRSNDRAIQLAQKGRKITDKGGIKGKRGYPIMHQFTTAIPSTQCVRCHSGNRSGTEYIGLFEHDDDINFNSPSVGKHSPEIMYGSQHHNLIPDIHFEKGMHCIDCHPQRELEGDGRLYLNKHYALHIKCEDCHGTPEKQPSYIIVKKGDHELKTAGSNPNYSLKAGDVVPVTNSGLKLGNVKKIENRLILTSKVTGKKHLVPLLVDIKIQPVSHRIYPHTKKIECHTCHSAWTSYNWGYNMRRVEEKPLKSIFKWWFSDPVIQDFLFFPYLSIDMFLPFVDKVKKEVIKSEMIDWLTVKRTKNGISGKKTTGFWWDFFNRKEWERVMGIVNRRGKISAAKPEHQWIISNNGINHEINRDSFFQPYVPHTQRKEGRMCEECHRNNFFILNGNNPFKDAISSSQPSTIDGARFFNSNEINKLQNKSKEYKYFRYLDLKEKRWEKMFVRKK